MNYVDPNGEFVITLTTAGIVALAALFVGGCQMMYSITNSGDNGLAGCVVDIYNDLTYTPPIIYTAEVQKTPGINQPEMWQPNISFAKSKNRKTVLKISQL